jgi:Prokaryotic homologs of the JAB domain
VNGSWAIRERKLPGGGVLRFLERPKPGSPGTVERRYPNGGFDRFSVPTEAVRFGSPGRQPGHAATVRRVAAGVSPQVRMTADAFRELWDLIEDCSPLDVETAGGLFGRIYADTLTIDEVLLAAQNQRHSSCEIDTFKVLARRDQHRERGDGRLLLGTWHSEPGYGDLKPSRADVVHWLSWLRAGDDPYFVGVTVRKPRQAHLGWKNSSVRAHVLARTTDGDDCASVVELTKRPWIL